MSCIHSVCLSSTIIQWWVKAKANKACMAVNIMPHDRVAIPKLISTSRHEYRFRELYICLHSKVREDRETPREKTLSHYKRKKWKGVAAHVPSRVMFRGWLTTEVQTRALLYVPLSADLVCSTALSLPFPSLLLQEQHRQLHTACLQRRVRDQPIASLFRLSIGVLRYRFWCGCSRGG